MRRVPVQPSLISSRPTRQVVLAAILAVVTFLVASLLSALPQAVAQTGKNVTSDINPQITLTRTNTTDVAYVGDTAALRFDWNITDASSIPIEAGDYYRIDLPDWLTVSAATLPMRNSAQQTVGSCVQTPKSGTTAGSVVCTFNEWIEDNPYNAQGYFRATSYVAASESVNNWSFPLTGEITGFPPGQTTVGTRPSVGNLAQLPTTDYKSGYITQSRVLVWDIVVLGTGEPITIVDPLQEPFVLDNYEVRVRDRDAEGTTGGNWGLTTDSTPGTATRFTDYTLTTAPETGATVATIVLNATEVGKVYRILLRSEQLAADAFANGVQISNTATVNGVERTRQITTTHFSEAVATSDPSVGAVQVFKIVDDPNELAPDDTVFTVVASWTDADGQAQSQNLVISPDNPATTLELPPGTVVTFREDTPAAGTGYSWQSPVFGASQYGNAEADNVAIADGGQSAAVTLVGGEVTAIAVRNTVDSTAGSLELTKRITGPGRQIVLDADKDYDATVICQRDGEEVLNEVVTVAGEESVVIDGIPVGATCVIQEDTDNVAVPGVTWVEDESVVEAAATIAALGVATEAELSNHYIVPGGGGGIVPLLPLIPLIPLLPGILNPSSPTESTPVATTTTPVPDTPGTADTPGQNTATGITPVVGGQPTAAASSTSAPATPSATGTGLLARTGADSLTLFALATGALIAGGALLVISRRRSR